MIAGATGLTFQTCWLLSVFCVFLSKMTSQKINDINVAVFIWFAATPAAPIAPYTCATSNSPRFPLLPFWKFLALTHGIWQVKQRFLDATVWACSTPLNAPRCGRRHIFAVSCRSVVIIFLKINIVWKKEPLHATRWTCFAGFFHGKRRVVPQLSY